MAEQPAVNRQVLGSSPSQGAFHLTHSKHLPFTEPFQISTITIAICLINQNQLKRPGKHRAHQQGFLDFGLAQLGFMEAGTRPPITVS